MLLCGVDAKRPLLHDLCIDNETIIPKLKKNILFSGVVTSTSIRRYVVSIIIDIHDMRAETYMWRYYTCIKNILKMKLDHSPFFH